MNKNFLHHTATAAAFLFLIFWYYILNHFGFFDYFSHYISHSFSEEYRGAGLMLGIGIGMTPAFFIWSQFNKWVEKKLNIKGKYFEDGFYKETKK